MIAPLLMANYANLAFVSAERAAGLILEGMMAQTLYEDRVWTNDEWRDAVQRAAKHHAAFDSILAAERTDWRNDDFAERVAQIRDNN